MATTQELLSSLEREKRICIDPKVGDADLWIKMWEVLHLLTSKEMLVVVEHVEAHRTEKEKKKDVVFRQIYHGRQ